MIVVTHEMGFARKAANRVAFMDDGQIVEEADPDIVLHQCAERTGQGLPEQDLDPLAQGDAAVAASDPDRSASPSTAARLIICPDLGRRQAQVAKRKESNAHQQEDPRHSGRIGAGAHHGVLRWWRRRRKHHR